MEELFLNFQALAEQHIQFAPLLIFGLLLLAGLNLPVSEDAMLFLSALLASKYPQHRYGLFIGVYMGAYISDLICYFLGRTLGNNLWRIKFLSSMASPQKLNKVHSFYEKYGILTLIFGRFIPFGVRNALFLSAGLGKMNAWKFSFSDLLACTISTVCFFLLYYNYGSSMIEIVKKSNIVIFSLAAIILVFVIWKKRTNKSNK